MNQHRTIVIAALLIIGVIGCQQRMTVIKARLIERENIADQQPLGRAQAEATARRYYANGLALLAAGDTAESAEQFHLAVETDSSIWSAHYFLGVLESASDPDNCLSHYRAALRFAPAEDSVRSRIYVAMGNCYEQQSSLTYAEQNYRTALKLNPFSEPARVGLERVVSRRQASE